MMAISFKCELRRFDRSESCRGAVIPLAFVRQSENKLHAIGNCPYILESVVHDEFAFIKKGGFPYVKYGNNWHVKG